MIAEEMAEYIRVKLKEPWPGLNGCDALECLIEEPDRYFYEGLKVPEMAPVKLGFWRRFWNRLKGLFRGKQN